MARFCICTQNFFQKIRFWRESKNRRLSLEKAAAMGTTLSML
jgi:hypothetical protein